MKKKINLVYRGCYGKPGRLIDMLGHNKFEAMEDVPEEFVRAGDRIGAYTFDLEEVELHCFDEDGKKLGVIT